MLAAGILGAQTKWVIIIRIAKLILITPFVAVWDIWYYGLKASVRTDMEIFLFFYPDTCKKETHRHIYVYEDHSLHMILVVFLLNVLWTLLS